MKKLLFIPFLLYVCTSVGQIKFEQLEWKQAIEKADKEGKILFVNACVSWSEPCQLLEKYTLADLEVSNFYNDTFVNIQLNVEEYPGIEISESLGIDVYPAMLFIDGSGELLHRGCGALDAGEFLELGRQAMGVENLKSFERRFDAGERKSEFILSYLNLMDESCLDVEGFASYLLGEKKVEELTDEESFLLIEEYQWDIFSREFQYLTDNRESFESILGKDRVNDKIFNTYLAQYQEIYDAEELHLFGMRALLSEVKKTSFTGSDTLLVMMNLHYYEMMEDWSRYSDYAIEWVGMTGLADPEELNDLAWKFYLFVNDVEKLKIATNWARESVDSDPNPSTIDTYASLLFKQGSKKKAIELERQAIEMAKKLLENSSHYEHQLTKFEGG
ncbi:MAG: DUF255 domain-containing protein [Cyclobacteriaceae bacterium]